MHELSIAENIIKIIKKDYRDIEGKINSISVDVGELTSIIPETLIYLFDIIKIDYGLNNVKLKVNLTKCKVLCENCGKVNEDYILDSLKKCKFCNSEKLTIIGGEELTLQNIEITD